MSAFDDLLDHLQQVVEGLEHHGPEVAGEVVELLAGLESLHRLAIRGLVDRIGRERLEAAAAADAAVGWLLDTYAPADDARAVDDALDEIRPYVHGHGGEIEVLDIHDGVVRVRLSGSCSGCTASSITLQHGVERVLRDHLPWFRALEVEEEPAPAHGPPGPTLLGVPGGRSLPLHPG